MNDVPLRMLQNENRETDRKEKEGREIWETQASKAIFAADEENLPDSAIFLSLEKKKVIIFCVQRK